MLLGLVLESITQAFSRVEQIDVLVVVIVDDGLLVAPDYFHMLEGQAIHTPREAHTGMDAFQEMATGELRIDLDGQDILGQGQSDGIVLQLDQLRDEPIIRIVVETLHGNIETDSDTTVARNDQGISEERLVVEGHDGILVTSIPWSHQSRGVDVSIAQVIDEKIVRDIENLVLQVELWVDRGVVLGRGRQGHGGVVETRIADEVLAPAHPAHIEDGAAPTDTLTVHHDPIGTAIVVPVHIDGEGVVSVTNARTVESTDRAASSVGVGDVGLGEGREIVRLPTNTIARPVAIHRDEGILPVAAVVQAGEILIAERAILLGAASGGIRGEFIHEAAGR